MLTATEVGVERWSVMSMNEDSDTLSFEVRAEDRTRMYVRTVAIVFSRITAEEIATRHNEDMQASGLGKDWL